MLVLPTVVIDVLHKFVFFLFCFCKRNRRPEKKGKGTYRDAKRRGDEGSTRARQKLESR